MTYPPPLTTAHPYLSRRNSFGICAETPPGERRRSCATGAEQVTLLFQYTIGAYFTDFCCPMCKLIVEIDDSSSHNGKELTNAQRTRRLDRGQHSPALLG
jgi:hypothetical protein